MARKKASDNNLQVGNIHEVSGEVIIAAGDIYKGYTAEQVSVLLTQITSKYQRKPFDGRCPYKGLDVFEEEDADLFFGREKLVDDLISRVKGSRTVFITGPSGSGKSSLVRAGLIYALRQGAIKNLHSERWLYETMKPGREPLEALALAFSRMKSPELANYFRSHANEIKILNECAESVLSAQKEHRFLLFVDQFEEVFTQISKEEERLAFINLLAHAGTVENGRVIVVFAMRSDFVSNCATYPALNELLSQQFRQIGAMQPEELVSAIALPARQVGLPIEDELIARIINDMKGEPGALPLMQFALKDLFDSQQEKGGVIALTLEDYLRHGGIQQSLERHADSSFAKLSEGEQELARSIFSGLIEIGRGTQDTKRTAIFDELVPANANPQEVSAVVGKLADARLITTDEQAGKDTVTISHEKLIDAWPWLKKLVNENRDAIALQNEIASDAKEWEEHKKDISYLYTGARLINAIEQLKSNKLVLSGTAFEYIHAGRARQRRGQYALIGGISAIIVLLFLAVIVFSNQSRINANTASTAEADRIEAEAQKANAQAVARTSRVRELAAQSVALRDRNFPASILLGIEAFKARDNAQTRGALMTNLYAHPKLQTYWSGFFGSVNSVAFSPNGQTVASGNSDGSIILWDIRTNQPIGEPLIGHKDAINCVVFSPDGKTLASGGDDHTIILWNVETGKPIGQPWSGHNGAVRSMAFSADGTMLASGSLDRTIILWNVETGQAIGQPIEYSNYIYTVAFSPDGKTLASGSHDQTIILWDVETRQPIVQPFTGHTENVRSVAFSPDGKILASSGEDNLVVLWNVETGEIIGQPLEGHISDVTSVAFSPDGKTLASGSGDNTIIIWSVATGQPIVQLQGHINWVNSVAFSPDGKTLVSGSYDGTIIPWNLETERLIGQQMEYSDWIYSVAFSPDGKTLASSGYDRIIVLWNVATRQPIVQLHGHTDSVKSIVFSPDGKTLASAGYDNTIILWDMETYQPIGQPLNGHADAINGLAFSPDGKTLASGSDDDTIILWAMETREPIGQPLSGGGGNVYSIAFNPDGKTLASGNADRSIILWDVQTGERVGQPLSGHSESVGSMAFSPDGKTLASGGSDGIIFWDMETSESTGPPLSGDGGVVSSVAFSPDGKTLASGGFNGTISLWDVKTEELIGEPLRGHTDWVGGLSFSPDGKTLASGSYDYTIILWDVDPRSWLQEACQRVGRNFTQVEWTQFFPSEAYRKSCEQLPRDSSYYETIAEKRLLESNSSQRIREALDVVINEMESDSVIKDQVTASNKIIQAVVRRTVFAELNANHWPEALSLLDQAKSIHLSLLDSPNFINENVCWDGSLRGYAAEVLEYCEHAVALMPDDADIRDSRGLARALTGDFPGAIEDFQFFVENSNDEELIQQRQQWIIDLKAGRNPFTAEVLEELKNQ